MTDTSMHYFTVWVTRLLLFCNSLVFGQKHREYDLVLPVQNGILSGILSLPDRESYPLAVIVAGSGPTDRDGYNPFLKSNNLKKLSDSLLHHGIATFRFDKRGIAKSASVYFKEEHLTFDTLVSDVVRWCELLKKRPNIQKIYIIGHSEGSLIGILAAQQSEMAGFVSVAGVGNTADILLKKQSVNLPPSLKQPAFALIDSLKANKKVAEVPMHLMPLFRPSVQPYLMSWMRYKPNQELKKLICPSLIVHGKRDMQVDQQEAYILIGGTKMATLELIENMDHLLFDVTSNVVSTNYLPLGISSQLVEKIILFVGKK